MVNTINKEIIMQSNFENNNSYEDFKKEFPNNEIYDDNLDKSIGWSSACFSETINYYNSCYAKTLKMINDNQ